TPSPGFSKLASSLRETALPTKEEGPWRSIRLRWRSPSPQRRQRVFEIVGEVLPVLQPYRQPQQTLRYAELLAGVFAEALMGGGGGVGDQALRIAEIVGDADDLQRVGDLECTGLPAIDLER